MKIVLTLAFAALLFGASAPAQAAPTAHQQHHPSASQAPATSDHCCCEAQMKQMMSMMHEMMQMHQQMQGGMKMPMPMQQAPGKSTPPDQKPQ